MIRCEFSCCARKLSYTAGDGQDVPPLRAPEQDLMLPPSLQDWLPEDQIGIRRSGDSRQDKRARSGQPRHGNGRVRQRQ